MDVIAATAAMTETKRAVAATVAIDLGRRLCAWE